MKPCFRPPAASPGVALVVTLLMMSVLVMMVVGLAGVMRNEQAAARNLTYRMLAEQLAEIGTREAAALLLSNAPGSASGPGWIQNGNRFVPLFLTNPAGGRVNLDSLGRDSLIFSLPDKTLTRTPQAGVWAGWNNVPDPLRPAVPIGRYSWWIDDEGTKVNLNAVGGTNTSVLPQLTNFPFAADWVFADPETGDVGTGSSSAAQRAQMLRSRTNYFFSPESLKDPNFTGSAMPFIGDVVYRRIKGGVTTWSANADLTPWDAPKINLANLGVSDAASRDEAYNRIRNALKTNAFNSYFGADADGVPFTFGRKYGGGGSNAAAAGNHGDLVLDQIAANILAAATTNQWPVVCTNFAPALGNVETNRFRNGLPMTVASDHLGPYLSEIRVRVDGASVNRIRVVGEGRRANTNLLSSAGVARLSFLVRLTNPYGRPVTGFSVEIQPRKFRFKVAKDTFGYNPPVPNPADGDLVPPTQLDSPPELGAAALSLYNIDGALNDGWWMGPEWYEGRIAPWDLGQIFESSINESSMTNSPIFSKRITFSMNSRPPPAGTDPPSAANALGSLTEAYVQLDQVVLKKDGVIVDWLSMDDLAQEGNFRGVGDPEEDFGQIPFRSTGIPPVSQPIQRDPAAVEPSTLLPPLAEGLFSDTQSQGIRKRDPRARFSVGFWETETNGSTTLPPRGALKSGGWPATVKAWSREISPSLTNTGITWLPGDPVTNGTTLDSHPHFQPGFYPTNGIRSVAQLGAIHTGLPWRTVRLQATPGVEIQAANGATNSPPDWILLDLFTATNPATVRTQLNVNSVPLALQVGGTGVVTNDQGASLGRPWPLLGTLALFRTNLTATLSNLSSNGVPISIAGTNHGWAETNLVSMATNLVQALAGLTNAGSTNGWASGSGWKSARSGQNAWGAFYPSNGLLFRGEVLEIAGVADQANQGEDVLEGRTRAFLDLLATRSDTFSVWTIAQGLMVNTNVTPPRTNVMGEVRKQTVFQRVPMFNPAGSEVTNYQARLLYTRNHVVE